MTDLEEIHVIRLRLAYRDHLSNLTVRQNAALMRYVRDVHAAGRRAGEAARWHAPAVVEGVDSPRTRRFWRAIELLASFTTLAGMWVGSTTVAGSLWYLLAGVLFIAIAVKRRLHGLQPLNLIALAIEGWNLWSAMR